MECTSTLSLLTGVGLSKKFKSSYLCRRVLGEAYANGFSVGEKKKIKQLILISSLVCCQFWGKIKC